MNIAGRLILKKCHIFILSKIEEIRNKSENELYKCVYTHQKRKLLIMYI